MCAINSTKTFDELNLKKVKVMSEKKTFEITWYPVVRMNMISLLIHTLVDVVSIGIFKTTEG